MIPAVPDRVTIRNIRAREFTTELQRLMEEAATGKHEAELLGQGIVLPADLPKEAVYAVPVNEQGVAAETLVVLAIKYSPLAVPIGLDLWKWAWPKLRDYFDGEVKEDDSTRR